MTRKAGQNKKTIWFYKTQSNSKLERRSMWDFFTENRLIG